ncbi:hypothetical protein HN937_20160, partial [Candidatus Poribacteria bacterium]|nr:hypothetical protein [Candidatus Poribacteria bacterium]
NLNSIYAAWAPTIGSQHCAGSSAGSLAFTGGSDEDLLAIRFRCPTDTMIQPAGLGVDFYAHADTAPTFGQLSLTTIAGGDTASVAISGASDAWFTPADVDYGDSSGYEIAVVSGYRTAGSNTPGLRNLHLYYNPYTAGAGALDAGVYNSGFYAADLLQYDSQSPLSAGGLSELGALHEILRLMRPWPISFMTSDLRVSSLSKTGHRMISDEDFPVMIYRCPYWRRRGEGVTDISYSIFGEAESSGSVRVKLRVGEAGDDLDDTGELTLPTNAAAPDHTDENDWLDGTIQIDDAPTGLLYPPVWLEVYAKSGTSGDNVAIYSVSFQEEPA